MATVDCCTDAACVPEEQGVVKRELDALQLVIGEVEGVSQSIASRLAPVLANAPCDDAKHPGGACLGVPLADELAENTRRLRTLVDFLGDIYSRLGV